jgi:hypothetical protein
MNREAFIKKVMAQLPGIEEPLIMVRLLAKHGTTPEQDAETVAEENQEPVAVVTVDGLLLAYRVPKK